MRGEAPRDERSEFYAVDIYLKVCYNYFHNNLGIIIEFVWIDKMLFENKNYIVMTKKIIVTDEQFGVVSKRLWEIQRRFKEGTLSFEYLDKSLQQVVEGKFNNSEQTVENGPILRLISAGEKIMLEANNGKSKIYGNDKTFNSYISNNFEKLKLNKNSCATPETLLDVYELIKDAKFAEIFNSLNCDLDKLVMTQSQIVSFCEKHPTWLRQNGVATFFLIKKNEDLLATNDNLFVVDVGVYSDGLDVSVGRFEYDSVWHARYLPRVVAPQLIA